MNEEKVLTPGEREHLIRPSVSTGAPSPQGEGKERTPEMIGAEIRMYVDAGRRITLLCGIEIGRRLVEAKEMLNHGQWLPWLERETEFSSSSAARYMKVFEEYGAAQLGLFGPETNSPTLGNLSISNALRLLELPEDERESFAKEVDAEHLSARDLEALVKERTAEIEAELKSTTEDAKEIEYRRRQAEYRLEEKEKDLEKEKNARTEAENARAEAEEQLRRIKAELDEIEKRPQAVVYERDEEAISEEVEAALQIERENAEKEKNRAIKDAVQAEREELEKERVKLKAKITELEEQAKKNTENLRTAQDDIRKAKADAKDAREAVQKAQQAEAEAERLRGDIEALRKQLSMAAPEVAEFKAAFERVQREFSAMLETLDKIQDGETKGKLRAACAAVLDGFMGRVKE